MRRILLSIAICAIAVSQLYAQSRFMPKTDLRPAKTVFLYVSEANAAVGEIDDPVYGKEVEALALTPTDGGNQGITEELTGYFGQLQCVGKYARFDLYFPERPNGQMIIMCPGGGYWNIFTYSEGLYGAEWFLQQGITVAVAKYRQPGGHWTVPLDDVQEIMRYCRAHAADWRVRQLGIAGFSAGGHLAATASTLYTDAATRPDFAILFYPVISFCDETLVHRDTRTNLLGSEAWWYDRRGCTADEYLRRTQQYAALKERYSPEKNITADTPETFIVLGIGDDVVRPENSLRYASALLQCGVKCELQIFDNAGHGFGFFPQEVDFLDQTVRSALLSDLKRWLEQINK